MILPDVNLLVHAYNLQSPVHARTRAWWEGLLNGTRPHAERGTERGTLNAER